MFLCNFFVQYCIYYTVKIFFLLRCRCPRCQRIVPRRLAHRKKELSRVHRYAPALGCKKPATYMDLAICWETPLDPAYEPRRPVHIDGSDGGPAPAVFTLVQHAESQTDLRDGAIPARPALQAEECRCTETRRPCDKCQQVSQTVSEEIRPSHPLAVGSCERQFSCRCV